MAQTLITKANGTSAAGAATATTGADIPAGSSVAVILGCAASPETLTFSDGTANVYNYIGNITNGVQQRAAYIASTPNDIPNGSTLTMASVGAAIGFVFAAFSGAPLLDINASTSGASGTITQSSGSLAYSNEAIFGGTVVQGNGTWGDSAGWINAGNRTLTGNATVGADYLLTTTNASQTFAPTIVGSSNWCTVIISFGAAGLVKFFSLMGVG